MIILIIILTVDGDRYWTGMANSASDSEHYVSTQAPYYAVRDNDEQFFSYTTPLNFPAAVYLRKTKVRKGATSEKKYPICQIPPEKL